MNEKPEIPPSSEWQLEPMEEKPVIDQAELEQKYKVENVPVSPDAGTGPKEGLGREKNIEVWDSLDKKDYKNLLKILQESDDKDLAVEVIYGTAEEIKGNGRMRFGEVTEFIKWVAEYAAHGYVEDYKDTLAAILKRTHMPIPLENGWVLSMHSSGEVGMFNPKTNEEGFLTGPQAPVEELAYERKGLQNTVDGLKSQIRHQRSIVDSDRYNYGEKKDAHLMIDRLESSVRSIGIITRLMDMADASVFEHPVLKQLRHDEASLVDFRDIEKAINTVDQLSYDIQTKVKDINPQLWSQFVEQSRKSQ